MIDITSEIIEIIIADIGRRMEEVPEDEDFLLFLQQEIEEVLEIFGIEGPIAKEVEKKIKDEIL